MEAVVHIHRTETMFTIPILANVFIAVHQVTDQDAVTVLLETMNMVTGEINAFIVAHPALEADVLIAPMETI